jgi:2-oxoglutarate ferredoxin oxidoreductase subunit beta
MVAEMELTQRTIAVFGVGCYTLFASNLDIEVLQALHGRAPSLGTGVKRTSPGTLVMTVQGDGDMVSEGLQEVMHAAARGEAITCVLLNNGVLGETGSQMTASTVLGQRTKNSLEGRDAEKHGYPIAIADVVAGLRGSSYVARCAVNSAGNVARTRRMIKRAFEVQWEYQGFSFVEILTMCPTGWFVDTLDAPDYLNSTLGSVYKVGVIKDDCATPPIGKMDA